MFKLKKETQFIFIALFAFLLLFEIFGYNFGAITGSATTSVYFGDLGTIMNEALTLPFESLVKPLFTTVFGADYYIYSIKILLIVVLSIIFSLGTSLLFTNNKKSARWIAIIFATLGVVLIPNGALEALFGTADGAPSFIGSLILALVILAFIIGIFIPLFKWKAQGAGNNVLRGIAFLVMIPLIILARATFAGFIMGRGPSFFSLALILISLVCIVMFFVSMIRAFSGGLREATGGDIVEGARRAKEGFKKGREALSELTGAPERKEKIERIKATTMRTSEKIDEIEKIIHKRGFDVDKKTAKGLGELKNILLAENADLKKGDLVSMNTNLISSIDNLIDSRNKPKLGMIDLKNDSNRNVIVDTLESYFSNRRRHVKS